MSRNPKSDENLKPIKQGELSKEEAKRRGSNGGKKSGEARRAKRDAKKAARFILDQAAKGQIAHNLTDLGIEENDQTNMVALQARLFSLAISGNLDAYRELMKQAGYDPEENRKERESISSEARRNKENDAKVAALEGGIDGAKVATNFFNEDEQNDVVIYLPQIDSIEECEQEEEKNSDGIEGN